MTALFALWAAAGGTTAIAALTALVGALVGALVTLVVKVLDRPNVSAQVAVDGLTMLVEQLRATLADDQKLKEALRREVQRLRVHVNGLERFLREKGLEVPDFSSDLILPDSTIS